MQVSSPQSAKSNRWSAQNTTFTRFYPLKDAVNLGAAFGGQNRPSSNAPLEYRIAVQKGAKPCEVQRRILSKPVERVDIRQGRIDGNDVPDFLGATRRGFDLRCFKKDQRAIDGHRQTVL